jgi:hypothetical protein
LRMRGLQSNGASSTDATSCGTTWVLQAALGVPPPQFRHISSIYIWAGPEVGRRASGTSWGLLAGKERAAAAPAAVCFKAFPPAQRLRRAQLWGALLQASAAALLLPPPPLLLRPPPLLLLVTHTGGMHGVPFMSYLVSYPVSYACPIPSFARSQIGHR